METPTARRQLLKLSGLGALGSLALGRRTALAQEPEPAPWISHACWTHGHSMEVEYPDRLAWFIPKGWGAVLAGQPGTENWFHFALPTTLIVDDTRLRIDSVMLRFATGSVDAFVRDVHVWDGDRRIAAHNDVYLSESQPLVRFPVPNTPEVFLGIGISVGVGFGVENLDHSMTFYAAGMDLVVEPHPEPIAE